MSRRHALFLASVTLALLPATSAFGQRTSFAGPDVHPRLAGQAVVGRPVAPDLALRDQDEKLVQLSSQRGRLVLLAFLYTHCRDVCPLIAGNLNDALRQLGSARNSVRVLAVSVDPRNDTPQAVRRFIKTHRLLPQFRYLTGTRQWLEPVWQAYHLVINPTNPDTVAHSAFVLLIDQAGLERAVYTSHVRAADLVHDLRLLLNERTRAGN